MSKISQSMFDSIKNSLSAQKGNGGFRDIMKLEIGNTYYVRLMPNTVNPERTFFHYYQHAWQSLSTGQFTVALCPTTYGEKCPICEARIKLYRENTDEAKKMAAKIKRQENWLANVVVVKDPKKEENNNQVKMLRYGKQLDKVIQSAITGDDAEEFGSKIFDLSKDGCNLRIKVEKNEGGYASYVASKFVSPSAIEGLNIEEAIGKMFDLDKVVEQKSAEQLKKMLDDHLYCRSEAEPKNVKAPVNTDVVEKKEVKAEAPAEAPKVVTDPSASKQIDDKLQDLLKDL